MSQKRELEGGWRLGMKKQLQGTSRAKMGRPKRSAATRKRWSRTLRFAESCDVFFFFFTGFRVQGLGFRGLGFGGLGI